MKWLNKLSTVQRKDLAGCQNRKVPKLAQLKADIAYQNRCGVVCHSCQSAWKTLQESK